MEPGTLLNADYLDIIFDNRNKRYGSYELRRNYDRRMKKAAFFVILSVSALLSFSFINARDTEHAHAGITKGPVVISDPLILPPVLPKVIIPPVTPPPPQHFKTAIFNIPKVVDDDVVPDKTMTEVKDLHNMQVGTTNSNGDDLPAGTAIAPGTGKGTGIVPGPSTTGNVPLVWVQQMPEFSGNMSEYLGKHLRYPESARSEGIQGQVLIRFVVNEDGSVTDATVVRGIGGGCDEEALHIVSAMPKWKPGKQNGMPVKVFFTLPIKFLLN